MTAMPKELATKRPATVTTRSPRTGPRTIDGQFTAVRGGMTGRGMFTLVVFVLLTAGMTGFVLSLIQQS